MSKKSEHLFFCGIGGSGMSALARAAGRDGRIIAGSDRLFDQGGGDLVRRGLEAEGIAIFPQNGEALDRFPADRLVVSSAVEPTVPDVKAALERGIPIVKRAELLAELFNRRRGIAVGGTSGKSTVTAMIGHILREAGRSPTVVNGAVMLNSGPADGLGNAWCGTGEHWVVEADESDRSIELYVPAVSVVTTVSEDHLPLPELRRLFADFAGKGTLGAVVGADCPEAGRLRGENRITRSFGIASADADFQAVNIKLEPMGAVFVCAGEKVCLPMPGRHNILNALAAMAAVSLLDISTAVSAQVLATFKGVKRRLQRVGTSPAGVAVIDDFAHNPEKIAATLSTLREFPGRIIVFYQPHGFGPTRQLRAGLVQAFGDGLAGGHVLLMPEIFFAGGTVTRDISSRDLLADIAASGVATRFCDSRRDTLDWLAVNTRSGDRVVVMGARDPSLSDFAAAILAVV